MGLSLKPMSMPTGNNFGKVENIMARYYVFKDGSMVGSTAKREEAIAMIRAYQEHEDHYLLRSEYSIIHGEEEFIPYGK